MEEVSQTQMIMEDYEIEKAFSNRDVYTGKFKGILPHGRGKYALSDGTVYDGDWEEGNMSGKGHMIWASGANYVGDFSVGYLHGYGSFTGPDGSFYQGCWRMNIQHGIGKKQYSDSDIYEGSWKEGVHEGNGRYSWYSGNTYVGSWKGGTMCGRGVMKWDNGDLFNGFWLNGLRHGSGICRFADGGYYFGTWSRGLKDGKGTFCPAGTKHPSLKKWCSSLGYYDDGNNLLSGSFLNSEEGKARPIVKRSVSEKLSVGGLMRNSSRISHKCASLDKNWTHLDPAVEIFKYGSSHSLSNNSEDGQQEVQDNNTLVYEREYMQGVLIKEKIQNGLDMEKKSKQRE